MPRGAFAALVLGVAAVGFGATWFVFAGAFGSERAQGSGAAPPAPLAALAPGFAGQLQCIHPNVAARTCRSLSSLTKGADGKIEITTSMVISEAPIIVMHATARDQTIKAGQVCGPVLTKHIMTEDFTVDGRPATDAQTQRLRQAVLAAMRRYLGREICELDVQQGGAFMATNFVDGAPDPVLTAEAFIWVSPDDGYTVAL